MGLPVEKKVPIVHHAFLADSAGQRTLPSPSVSLPCSEKGEHLHCSQLYPRTSIRYGHTLLAPPLSSQLLLWGGLCRPAEPQVRNAIVLVTVIVRIEVICTYN